MLLLTSQFWSGFAFLKNCRSNKWENGPWPTNQRKQYIFVLVSRITGKLGILKWYTYLSHGKVLLLPNKEFLYLLFLVHLTVLQLFSFVVLGLIVLPNMMFCRFNKNKIIYLMNCFWEAYLYGVKIYDTFFNYVYPIECSNLVWQAPG